MFCEYVLLDFENNFVFFFVEKSFWSSVDVSSVVDLVIYSNFLYSFKRQYIENRQESRSFCVFYQRYETSFDKIFDLSFNTV